jgi:hypothetical protein
VDRTGSGLCPVAGPGISTVEPSGPVNRELMSYLRRLSHKCTYVTNA